MHKKRFLDGEMEDEWGFFEYAGGMFTACV
jgi:hypothetical protein